MNYPIKELTMRKTATSKDDPSTAKSLVSAIARRYSWRLPPSTVVLEELSTATNTNCDKSIVAGARRKPSKRCIESACIVFRMQFAEAHWK